MLHPRVRLITGASSGFGRAPTEVVLHKGDIVVATLRKPSALAPLAKQYPSSQLVLLTLDVTCPSDISAAFNSTQEIFGRLDVVFNNAGYAFFGEAEATPDADAQALFDVNFWGAVGVSREAVRFFREVNLPGKGGILLQNCSMMSFSGVPGIAFYCASKYALEGFSDSLSKELSLEWNIGVCILRPGLFDTNIFAGEFLTPHPAYANSATVALRDTYRKISPDGDPYKFGETVYQVVASADEGKKIPLFLPIGEDALRKLKLKIKSSSETLVKVASFSADLQKESAKVKNKMAKL